MLMAHSLKSSLIIFMLSIQAFDAVVVLAQSKGMPEKADTQARLLVCGAHRCERSGPLCVACRDLPPVICIESGMADNPNHRASLSSIPMK